MSKNYKVRSIVYGIDAEWEMDRVLFDPYKCEVIRSFNDEDSANDWCWDISSTIGIEESGGEWRGLLTQPVRIGRRLFRPLQDKITVLRLLVTCN